MARDYCRPARSLRIDPFWWLVAGLLAVVFLYLRRTTAGLYWPYDVDLYRDIGQAESVLRGELLSDFHYRGEAAWYNPLLSWVVAAGAGVTGSSVSRVATQGGVVLNLLAPVALAVLARRWFGRLAAGFALIAYVFLLVGNWPSWAVATYSPWLFAANFAQGFFFIGLLALPGAIDGDGWRPVVLFGALLGLVGLAHTAPALLLLAIFLAVLTWRTRSLPSTWRRIAGVGVPAALVVSPFLIPLAWRYQFRIENQAPAGWAWEELQPDQVFDFLRRLRCGGRCS